MLWLNDCHKGAQEEEGLKPGVEEEPWDRWGGIPQGLCAQGAGGGLEGDDGAHEGEAKSAAGGEGREGGGEEVEHRADHGKDKGVEGKVPKPRAGGVHGARVSEVEEQANGHKVEA